MPSLIFFVDGDKKTYGSSSPPPPSPWTVTLQLAKPPPITIASGSNIFIRFDIPMAKSFIYSSFISCRFSSFSEIAFLKSGPEILYDKPSLWITLFLYTKMLPYFSKHPNFPQLHLIPPLMYYHMTKFKTVRLFTFHQFSMVNIASTYSSTKC